MSIEAQKRVKDPFTYEKAMKLIEKLIEKRKEYGREGELMIGARTCMRPENEGGYIKTAKKLGKMGADSFQIVKILIPMGDKIEKYKLTKETIKELTDLHDNYEQYGLMHIQVPHNLDYMYYDRKLEDVQKPSQCFSSLVSPILYGPNLVICTHWEKIKDVEGSHYCKMTGKVNELEKVMEGKHAIKIRKSKTEKCSSCCSIFDNQVLDMIRAQLALENDLEGLEFYLTY